MKSPYNPFLPFSCAWQHRTLIARLAKREIEARYRGSILGVLWAFVVPILMLGVYTFVFSIVFQIRWEVPMEEKGAFALLLFSGLIIFNLFSECVTRAPGLMLENVSYIKRVSERRRAWIGQGKLMPFFNEIIALTDIGGFIEPSIKTNSSDMIWLIDICRHCPCGCRYSGDGCSEGAAFMQTCRRVLR